MRHDETNNIEDFKYWAFISYSHSDKSWGKWLHNALETYRMPSKLVGKISTIGPVPKRVYPVFLDQEELSTSSNLGEGIDQALRASRCLIVICSPRSVVSQWVNEEIKRFKALGREKRVFCLIVDGEPNASDSQRQSSVECFPETVRFGIGPDAKVTDVRVEPLAADVRQGKGNKQDALLKLLAGILAIDYDDLKQRDQTRRIRRLQLFCAVSLVAVATLTLLGIQLYNARNLALNRLMKSYEDHGFSFYLDGKPAEALAYFNELRRIDPEYSGIRLAMADVWSKLESLRAEIPGEESKIIDIRFNKDGTRLATQDDRGRTRIISINDVRLQGGTSTFLGHMQGPVLANKFDYLVGFSRITDTKNPDHVQRYINLINWQDDSIICRLEWPEEWFDANLLVLSPGSKHLLSYVGDLFSSEKVYIWNLEDSNRKPTPVQLDDSDSAGSYIWRFSADEKHLLQIRYSGDRFFMIVRDAATGSELQRLPLDGRVEAIDAFADRIALGLHNGRVSVYQLNARAQLLWQENDTHKGSVSTLRFSLNGESLLTADVFGGVSLLSANNGTPIWRPNQIETSGVLNAASLSPDGHFVAITHRQIVDIYRVADSKHIYRLPWSGEEASAIAFDTKSSRIAVGTNNGDVKIWSLDNEQDKGVVKVNPPKEESCFTRLQSLGDGTYLVYGHHVYRLRSEDGALAKIDDNGATNYVILPTHNISASTNWNNLHIEKRGPDNKVVLDKSSFFEIPPHLFSTPITSPAALLIAVAGGDMVVLSPDGHPMKNVHQGDGKSGSPGSAAFSSDGRIGFVSFNDGSILQFDINNMGIDHVGKHCIKGIEGPAPQLLGFAAKESLLLMQMHNIVYIYDVLRGSIVPLPRQNIVGAALVQPTDSTLILCVTQRGTVEVWDSLGNLVRRNSPPRPDRKGISLYDQKDKAGSRIAISPSGDRAATTLNDRVYLWSLPDLSLLWRSDGLIGHSLDTPHMNVVEFNKNGQILAIEERSGFPDQIERVLFVSLPQKIPSVKEAAQYLERVARITLTEGRVIPVSK